MRAAIIVEGGAQNATASDCDRLRSPSIVAQLPLATRIPPSQVKCLSIDHQCPDKFALNNFEIANRGCSMTQSGNFRVLAAAAFLVAGSSLAQAQSAPNEWEGPWAGGSIGWKWIDTDYRGNPNEIAEPPATVTQTGAAATANRLSSGTPVSKSGSFTADGFTAGVLAGTNRLSGRWLFGIEADADLTTADGSEVQTQTSIADYDGNATNEITFARRNETCRNSKDMWFEGALRGRVGYLAGPNTLLFATAGVSTAAVEHEVDCQLTTTFVDDGGGVPTDSFTHTTRVTGSDDEFELGWTLGAGIESVISEGRWRSRFDYAYVDLGSSNQSLSVSRQTSDPLVPNTGPDSISYNWDEHYHKIRVSLVYAFGDRSPPPLK